MARLIFKSYKSRVVEEGQEVFVYRNLHNDLWSIKMATKPYHVLGHAEVVVLKDCEFVVSESGRQRVLATKNKQIHAGVKGKFARDYTLVANGDETFEERFRASEVTYNPYKYDSFVRVKDKSTIEEAKEVFLSDSKRVFAIEG